MVRLAVIMFAAMCMGYGCEPAPETGYQFRGNISEEVLRNYLSRAVTHSELCTPPQYKMDGADSLEDDLRMLREIGVKFIGRSIFRWGEENIFNDPEFLKFATDVIDPVHVNDPDVIFQAALFEIVTPEVEGVAVPEHVFRAFGLPVEERNFSYGAMVNLEGIYLNHWGEERSVPDISRMESLMWYYFMASQYIDAGFEAIHWGQVALMAMNDPEFRYWNKLLSMVRSYARENAHRGYVLSDAHAPFGGFKYKEQLLFDFHSFPLRIKGDTTIHMRGILKEGHLDALYNKSWGGITPSGWETEHLPYLVEFDNFGISSDPGNPVAGEHFIWGYDEITWFSLKSEEEQKEWLSYAYHWLKETDREGYLQMPTCRVVIDGVSSRHKFKANLKSETCPGGTGLETRIKELWIQGQID
ncbi:MAG: hypothetical protein ABFS28_00070 [Bacteroidota bacterium]